jgi:hypothetical protein
MADLLIKPNTGSGNKLILQDQAGNAVLTTADSGATIGIKGHWDWLATGAFSSNIYTFTGTSTAYNNYRIIVEDLLQGSARGVLKLNITHSGTAFTGSNYKTIGSYVIDSTKGDYYYNNQPYFRLSEGNIGGGNAVYFDIVISNLCNGVSGFNDNFCGLTFHGWMGGETYMETINGGGQLNSTTTRDGFVLASQGGGTLNGQVTVFGQRAY